MLWSIDDGVKVPLTEKIKKAAEYYKEKYKKIPDTCLLNPIDMPEKKIIEVDCSFGKLYVMVYRCILPGNLWIGQDDEL